MSGLFTTRQDSPEFQALTVQTEKYNTWYIDRAIGHVAPPAGASASALVIGDYLAAAISAAAVPTKGVTVHTVGDRLKVEISTGGVRVIGTNQESLASVFVGANEVTGTAGVFVLAEDFIASGALLKGGLVRLTIGPLGLLVEPLYANGKPASQTLLRSMMVDGYEVPAPEDMISTFEVDFNAWGGVLSRGESVLIDNFVQPFLSVLKIEVAAGVVSMAGTGGEVLARESLTLSNAVDVTDCVFYMHVKVARMLRNFVDAIGEKMVRVVVFGDVLRVMIDQSFIDLPIKTNMNYPDLSQFDKLRHEWSFLIQPADLKRAAKATVAGKRSTSVTFVADGPKDAKFNPDYPPTIFMIAFDERLPISCTRLDVDNVKGMPGGANVTVAADYLLQEIGKLEDGGAIKFEYDKSQMTATLSSDVEYLSLIMTMNFKSWVDESIAGLRKNEWVVTPR